MFIRFDVIHERDGQTDGETDIHCMTAKTYKLTVIIIIGMSKNCCIVDGNFSMNIISDYSRDSLDD